MLTVRESMLLMVRGMMGPVAPPDCVRLGHGKVSAGLVIVGRISAVGEVGRGLASRVIAEAREGATRSRDSQV
ncbi:hypothetical protein HYQ46_005560 [Verticillium longisporum]|nr:hypothetical protein HYQ46_005560 [Verticillium longisporum]